MSNVLLLVSRVLLAALFIVFGFIKFQNISFFLNLREIKQVTELVGIGPSPLWFGYLVATIEVLGGIAILIGYQDPMGCMGPYCLPDHRNLSRPSVLGDGRPRPLLVPIPFL